MCVRVTEEFLGFSQGVGNDLSTPVEAYGFPGLRAGDRWCLCVMRWAEALEAGEKAAVASAVVAAVEAASVGAASAGSVTAADTTVEAKARGSEARVAGVAKARG